MFETAGEFAGMTFLSAKALKDVGAELTTGELLETLDIAWRDIAAGRSFGSKAVLSLPEETFWTEEHASPLRDQFKDERLGWKLSCLYSVNDRYGGAKVIGANAFNRHLGLPRSTSTILLLEKRTLRPVTVMDGTSISSRRTGGYATKVMEAFCAEKETLSIFLFGTGPTARAIVECLDFRFAGRIARIVVRGRSPESAIRFVDSLEFAPAAKIEPVGDNRLLGSSHFVITATNARAPLFADGELHPQAVSLHLGGDEAPGTYLQRVLRSGLVVCDDMRTVSRRNSQSIALHFSRRGLSLEDVGPLLGIADLHAFDDGMRNQQGPVCVTCVGLPMLDLYAAEATYEKYRRLSSAQTAE